MSMEQNRVYKNRAMRVPTTDFDSVKAIHWESTVFWQMVLEQLDIHIQKNNSQELYTVKLYTGKSVHMSDNALVALNTWRTLKAQYYKNKQPS